MVKKDLAEFSSVMQEDTVKAAAKVKEKLSVSCQKFLIHLILLSNEFFIFPNVTDQSE